MPTTMMVLGENPMILIQIKNYQLHLRELVFLPKNQPYVSFSEIKSGGASDEVGGMTGYDADDNIFLFDNHFDHLVKNAIMVQLQMKRMCSMFRNNTVT